MPDPPATPEPEPTPKGTAYRHYWRDPAPETPTARRNRARRRKIFALQAGILALAGAIVGMLYWVRPIPTPRLLALWVARPMAAPPVPMAGQELAALRRARFFEPIGPEADDPSNLDRSRLAAALAGLRAVGPMTPVVVYVRAAARGGGVSGGPVVLLPADAPANAPRSGLPLADVLAALKSCRARHALLILDLEAPPGGPDSPDVVARLPAELDAVKDPRRLVLVSRSAGQGGLVSEVLGRSIFGHYVEEGLHGWADQAGPRGRRDGLVTVRELADFVAARVDRWARRNRDARQVPKLRGSGADFTLVALDHGVPRAHAAPPVSRDYPRWLVRAWSLHDRWRTDGSFRTAPQGFLSLGEALLEAEARWRAGEDEATIQAKGGPIDRLAAMEEALNTARVVPHPEPHSLALAAALGRVPHPAAASAIATALQARAGLSAEWKPEEVASARSKIIADFLDATRALSDFDLARATFDRAAAEAAPDAETIRFLDGLLSARQREPIAVETLALRRAAGLSDLAPWPTVTVRRLLEVADRGHRAEAQPRAFPWVRPALEAAAESRHEAEVQLVERGYASLEEATEHLREALARYDAIAAREDAVQDSWRALEEAVTTLPGYLPFLAESPRFAGLWGEAARRAIELHEALTQPPGEASEEADLRRRFEEVSGQAAALRADLMELLEPFGTDAIHRLIDQARRPEADAAFLREVDALLATPLLVSATRADLWAARMDLARRLHEETEALDRQEDARGEPDLEILEPEPEGLELDRGTDAVARARLAAELIDRAGRLVPAMPDETGLWAWLADRLEHEARDLDGPELLARAAAEARKLTQPPPRPTVDFPDAATLPRLTPERPAATLTLPISLRWPTGTGPEPVEVTVLRADDDWLRIEPEGLGSAPWPMLLPPAASGPRTIPLRVTMLPGGDTSGTPLPLGFLVRVRVGGRSHHQRVPIDLLPASARLRLLLGREPVPPTSPLGEVRLRPVGARQPFYLFVQNPTTRARKVGVELKTGSLIAGGIARLVAEPRAASPVAFGDVPLKPEDALPELPGPLQLMLRDEESGEVLDDRTLLVSVASPAEYVRVTDVRFQPPDPASGGKDRLEVTLKATAPIPGPPCPVDLVLPPDRIPGLIAVEGGTLHGILPPDGTPLRLFAEDIRRAEEADDRGFISLDVDGVPRAMVFRTTFARSGDATSPLPDVAPDVRLRMRPAARTGAPLAANVEVDNAPPGARLEVRLGREEPGGFRLDRPVQTFDEPRRRRVGFAPSGPVLLFTATIEDRAVPLETGGIQGRRTVKARLLRADGTELAAASLPIVLDETAPGRVGFVDLPAQAKRGSALTLTARGTPSGSGIHEVVFFLGQPADEKIPPGVPTAPGEPVDASRTTWTATLALPEAARGPTEVSAMFVSGVGQATFTTGRVELTDAEPVKYGRIEGAVFEGPRPQPKLGVYLLDEKRVPKGQTATGPDGRFTFEKVPPGKYTVYTLKQASNTRGELPVEVPPGGKAQAQVKLFR